MTKAVRIQSLLVALILLAVGASLRAENKGVFFNGKDLTGWKVPKDNIWFLVKEGILKVRSGPKKKGHILWTETEYRDFVVECDRLDLINGVNEIRLTATDSIGTVGVETVYLDYSTGNVWPTNS